MEEASFTPVILLLMPRYYFDVHDDGTVTRDDAGVEVADLRAAETGAVKALADMARDMIVGVDRRRLRIDVRNDEGPAFTVALNFRLMRR
jgi:hypothetical protein